MSFCIGRVNFSDLDSCVISQMSSLGSLAEHVNVWPSNAPSTSETEVRIGKRVRVREFVTVNCGLENPTIIGDDCFLLAKSHVGHDSVLGKGVILSTGSIVGGHSEIGDHCYLGLNSSTHQRAKMGAYCILGANSFFKGESPAGVTWAGLPAKPLKVNLVGIERHCPIEDQPKVIEEAEAFIQEWQSKNKNK